MTEIKINKTLYYTFLLILSTISLYIISLVFKNLDKGFELSDESYYGLASQYPFQVKSFASTFGIINAKFCFGNFDLYSLRVFKLFYQIISLIGFCAALFFYIKKKFKSKSKLALVGLLAIFVSGFTNYDYLPQTLSYNSWSQSFSLIFWAFFLWFCINESAKLQLLLSGLIGFVLALLFYTKLPNAILMFAIFSSYVLFFNRKWLLFNLIGILVGAILSVLFLFGSFAQFSVNTTILLNDILGINHASIGVYLEQIYVYLSETLNYKLVTLEIIAIVILFFFDNKIKLIFGFLIVIANLFFSLNCFAGNSSDITNDFTFLTLMLMSAMVIYFLFKDKILQFEFNKEFFLIISMLCSPLLLALGTNNSLFYTGSQLMVFAVAAAVILLILCQDKVALLSVGSFGILIAFFLISILNAGMISAPYRQTSLKNKNLPLYFSIANAKIYEDYERFVLFYNLNEKMKRNNADGYPMCAEFSYVGAAYLTGISPLKYFWLPDPGYGYQKVKETFKTLKFTNEKKFVLMSSKNAKDTMYLRILKENNLDLNKTFKLCDSLYVNYNKEYIYFYKTM